MKDNLIKYIIEYIEHNKKHECFQFVLDGLEFQLIKDSRERLEDEIKKIIGTFGIDLSISNEGGHFSNEGGHLRIDTRNKEAYKTVLPK